MCLVYAYFFKHLSLSMLISFMLIKKECITRELFFFKTHSENKVGRLVSDLIFFLKKALYEVNVCGLHISFNISQ